ncbi:hypothetical protein [Amycolatopsis sp. NPDC001319]|uniref:hypothetical protein n=1 Tax=unclassified Amycolatopsis TaxID=2618356 RepID=UPI0036CD4FAF
MTRVRASDVVLLLHQEAAKREQAGDLAGAKRLRIGTATLRKWVQRRHITRGSGGYDLAEILTYIDHRENR